MTTNPNEGICFRCRFLHRPLVPGENMTCDAFPDKELGIPMDIITGAWDHREPFVADLDNGITFEEVREGEDLKEKHETDPAKMSYEEFIDFIAPHEFMKSARAYLVNAMLNMQKWTDFAKLGPQEAEEVYASMIEIMSVRTGWTLNDIIDRIMNMFPQLTFIDAERIARTETTAIANKARELDFAETEPDDTLYTWDGPDDDRTSEICRVIKERLNGNGMRLEDLNRFIKDVGLEFGMKPRDWCPHPNCRHYVQKWYGDIL